MTAPCTPRQSVRTPAGPTPSDQPPVDPTPFDQPQRPSTLRDAHLRLTPGTVLVHRDTARLQVGLVRDRAVEVTCTPGLPPAGLAAVLKELDGSSPLGAVLAAHRIAGPEADHLVAVVEQLELVGHLRRVTPGPDGPRDVTPAPLPHLRTVALLGTGPVAHRLRSALELNGCRVEICPPPGCGLDDERPPWRLGGRDPDLVVLTDAIVPDPLVTRALVAGGTPHLHVHCRDGRVVVGPTVLPGATSCLRCADLHRAERDPLWPRVAAQLLGVESTAPTPTLAAGAALVLAEVTALRGAGGQPQTLGATVEVSPGEGVWRRHPWPAHPRCTCGSAAAAPALP